MIDPNGDRSLPPPSQPDPDQYVHVVEIRKYCIVVRGVEEHQTGAVNSHEIITMGTAAVDYLKESMHGNGSQQAQRIMISRTVNLEAKKRAAKKLCGIEE
ncbi:MAG: 4-hydroxyphenylacetate 3-hydroxylase N-terminal domain-containing protein [Anaerolineales bacterium]